MSTQPEAPAAVPAPHADLEWRRFHPVTPAVKGWKVVLVVLAIAAQQVGNNVMSARELVGTVGWLPVVGALAVVVLVGFVYAALAWRMTRYAADAEAVYLHSGVLFRQQRSARLDRIQAIDVVQPLLARLFGLAELKIEVAGGTNSAVRLAFLKEEEAQQVRNELLARAAGVAFGTPEQPAAPVAPEREVLVVPPGRLVASLVRTSATWFTVVFVVGALAAAVASGEIATAFAVVPPAAAAAGYLWQRFAGEFNFRAAVSPDGVRMRRGLLETRAQTLPPGRVQAVQLTQPLLWRGKDWWRVQVNVAGYGAGEPGENQQSQTVLLPVGDRDDAVTALWLVLPDLGSADPRPLLDVALSGSGSDGGFVTSPRTARWLDPWSWRRNGFVVTERALLLRGGRFVRRLVVVPHERTQSLGLTQGPLQRRLGVGTFVVHSVPGPVSPRVEHLTGPDVARLMDEQAGRARSARRSAGPERWMTALAERAEQQGATALAADVRAVHTVADEEPPS